METPLFGKNLCNLLCNEIIKNYNEIDLNHKTEIKVIDLEQFIVLKGKTSIVNSINYSTVFKSFINNKNNSDRNFNVIDLIEYGVNPSSKLLNIEFNFDERKSYQILELNNTIQGEYYINYDNNIILHSNHKLFEYIVSEPEFTDFEGKLISNTYPFVSDDIFGKSLNSSKLYEIYLKYISYNLFEKHLCKDVNFKLFYMGEISDLSWENIDFTVDSNSLIVSKDWVKSLILDLFDFNYLEIKKHLSLDDYDFSNEILSNDRCWKKRDKVSEMFLL